jgi:hypothetical protein
MLFLLFRIMMIFTILLKKITIFFVANLCISYLNDVVGWNAYSQYVYVKFSNILKFKMMFNFFVLLTRYER